MKCLRSGYCCIHYDVIIVDNPDLGIIDGNLKHKPSGIKCQHLRGESLGKYYCNVHDQPWYDQSPCYDFGQVEDDIGSLCRMGEYQLRVYK